MVKGIKAKLKTKASAPTNLFTLIRDIYDGRFSEISAAIVVAIPPTGEIVSVNLETEELTGYEASELQGMRFLDIFSDEDRDRVSSLFDVPGKEERSFRKLFEHNVIIQKRSKRKIIVDMGFRQTHVHGQPIYIFTLQDITDLKNSENQLRQDLIEKEKAQRLIAEQQMMLVHATKMTALGEMASGIAHEINNPLHIIKGRCELLALDIEKKMTNLDPLKDGVSVIGKMASRIESIVNGLRTFSRDYRESPLAVTPLSQIFEETLILCEKRIRNAGIKLDLPSISPDLAIMCRPTQISQVIVNLLNNAYDALTEDRTLAGPQKFIAVTIHEQVTSIILTISNGGRKIDKTLAEKIFNPFFTTKAIGKGTGLGLSISKAIVEEHAGEISVDWQHQHTAFVVRLPKAKLDGHSKNQD